MMTGRRVRSVGRGEVAAAQWNAHRREITGRDHAPIRRRLHARPAPVPGHGDLGRGVAAGERHAACRRDAGDAGSAATPSVRRRQKSRRFVAVSKAVALASMTRPVITASTSKPGSTR